MTLPQAGGIRGAPIPINQNCAIFFLLIPSATGRANTPITCAQQQLRRLQRRRLCDFMSTQFRLWLHVRATATHTNWI